MRFLCDYLYADNENESLTYKKNLNSRKGPLYKNWSQDLKKENKYLMWNDQPGWGEPGWEKYAHDKGWLIWNETSGVLCTHTAPNWPNNVRVSSAFDFGMKEHTPGTKTRLSQHFLLISLTAEEILEILEMLKVENAKYQYVQVNI